MLPFNKQLAALGSPPFKMETIQIDEFGLWPGDKLKLGLWFRLDGNI